MPDRQVDHVDVIAHAGAVRSRVIAAIHGQLLTLAAGHLGDVGHQVVGNAVRGFTDQAAFVGTHGIEVAQQRDAPGRPGPRQVAQHLFDHQLAAAVGIGGGQGKIFRDGHGGRVAIHGGRGTEHQGLDTELLHRFKQHDGTGDVVVVVAQGLFDGFAHRFQTREVDDGVDLVVPECPFHSGAVADVGVDEAGGLAGDALDALLHGSVAVAEVIEDDDAVASLQEFDAGVGTDIAHAAGDKDVHVCPLCMRSSTRSHQAAVLDNVAKALLYRPGARAGGARFYRAACGRTQRYQYCQLPVATTYAPSKPLVTPWARMGDASCRCARYSSA